jgi:hypothetical protein
MEAQQSRSPPRSSQLSTGLQAGLVAIAAFAFTFDGFYDTVRNELGRHPDEGSWKRTGTSRAAQVCETLRYNLKLGPKFAGQLRQCIDELFKFRSRAVHPDGKWVQRTQLPSRNRQRCASALDHILRSTRGAMSSDDACAAGPTGGARHGAVKSQ